MNHFVFHITDAMSTPRAGGCRYTVNETAPDALTIDFEGRMDAAGAGTMIAELKARFSGRQPRQVTADLSKVSYLDDFGALVLLELRGQVAAGGGTLELAGVSRKISEMLDLVNFSQLDRPAAQEKKTGPGVFVRLGDAALEAASDIVFMITFIGSVCLALLHTLRHPGSLRRDDLLLSMQKTGTEALPIVGLISFLMGLIIAFMSSVQLQQFGANIYVASLVGLAMCRELGPIMTAIIVAGRSGSAFAAEIGTMQVSEEVDALVTMGFDPTRFLVVPKMLAAVCVVPLLTLFSDVFAIVGGLLVGVGMLDLTVSSYIDQTIKSLKLFDVFWGIGKSAVFALLITWVGCLRGFQVRGGAAAVGQATTSAVVSSLFLIIAVDAVFAVVLRYCG